MFYECNAKLESLIKNFGWIETTNAIDQKKGKKEFRKAKNSRTCIRFDYINIVIYENGAGVKGLGGSKIAREDLRMFFWYINSVSRDRDYISDGHFDLNKVRQRIHAMNSLLLNYNEFNIKNQEKKRLSRLLNSFNSVSIN